MRKLCLAAGSAAILVSASAQAESLSSYATTCAQELGVTSIPGYTCTQGSLVANPGALFTLGNLSNNWLGRVPTSNPNVEAIFLCRGTSSTASLNGYILQNTITGNTCFFDAKENTSSTVPSPNASNATNNWETPGPPGDFAYNGFCQTCHSADPFIVSPGLAPAMKAQKMIRRGRNLRGAYNIVNSTNSQSHFSNWNAERQLVSNSGCALACHNTSNNSDPVSWFGQAQSQGWMPPPANQDFVPPSETPASIGVWRPGSPATFFLDADGSRSWNGPDQAGFFGETGDKPFVMRGTDCSLADRQHAEFGTTRGSTWLLTNNNHFWDQPDNQNTFTHGSGAPLSWNGVAVNFQNGGFTVDYNNNRSVVGDHLLLFGTTGDKPLIGRWKQGTAHRMGIFRANGTSGSFALESNGNNIWDSGDTSFFFGAATDLPFAGDFNGDGVDEIGVFRNGTWFVDMNNNFTWNGTAGGDAEWFFGQAGDIPAVSPTKWNCAW